MRMRRKRNLDSRMENCLDYVIMRKSTGIYRLPEEERYDILDIPKIFGNNNPLYLEIGCGKGRFITTLAEREPQNNFLGIEMVGNVIVSAAERTKEMNLNNVRFLNIDASILTYVLEKESVSGIYLNFSCPFPKDQYENNRLTYKLFLERYKYVLKKDGFIKLKTDKKDFFDYSINSLRENGFEVEGITYDLYAEGKIDNIQTEYEEKFVNEGCKICYFFAYQK